MQGQVYLKPTKALSLTKTQVKYFPHRIEFQTRFCPQVRDIVPFSKNPQDQELALHLRQIVKQNQNGVMGDVILDGEINFSDENVPRPQPNEEAIKKQFYLKIGGSFPWMLDKLSLQNSYGFGLGVKVQISNLFVGKENRPITSNFVDVKATGHNSDRIWFDQNYSYTQFIAYWLNATTWDNLFRAGKRKRNARNPKVTLLLCANLSERMAKLSPIIGSHGSGYSLTFAIKAVVDQRKLDIKHGKQADAVIVGQNSKEWPVFSEYIMETSPVIQAMLQNPGFVEGQTKRINLEDLEDKVVECMLAYLYYFDLTPIINDLGLAITMLELAERFQMDVLKSRIELMLLRRSIDDFEICQALKLFTFTRNLGHFICLTRKVVRIIWGHRKKLDDSKEFQELFLTHPQLAKELYKMSIESAKSFLRY